MYFAYGEMTALCLATLRTAGRPLNTVELLDALVRAKSIVWRRTEEGNDTRRSIKRNGNSNQTSVILRVGTVGTAHDTKLLFRRGKGDVRTYGEGAHR